MFNIDFDNIPQQLIPGLLRRPQPLAWFKSCLIGVKLLYQDFMVFRSAKLKEVTYNSQTMMLTKFLNDTYPDAAGGIYIINVVNINRTGFISTRAEAKPAKMSTRAEGQPWVIKNRGDIVGHDFEVWVPLALTFDSNEMRANVDKYRLASKRFIIKTY